jgi:hypothetical protein
MKNRHQLDYHRGWALIWQHIIFSAQSLFFYKTKTQGTISIFGVLFVKMFGSRSGTSDTSEA